MRQAKTGSWIGRAVGAFALASAALMTPSADAWAEDVVLGAIVPLTGPLAPLGIDMRNGYELAIKDAPTIKGQPVKLVVEDDRADAAATLQKAQKLVLEDEVKALVGGASSAGVLGLTAQAPRLNVPILTTNSQAVQVTGEQCSRFVFRTNPNDAMMANGNKLLTKARPDLLQKKWFVVFHDFVWGKSNKEQFAKIPGITIVGEAGRPLGTADWSSAISQIQASGADAIYLALAVGDDMPAFIRQARSFGIKDFMLPPLGMPDSMLQALGDQAEGLITGGLFGSWMYEDQNPALKKFVDEYYAAYQRVPGPQAIQAYAGMRLLLAALDKADSLDTDAIIAALEATEVDTVTGHLAIRKEDHQGTVGTYVAEAAKLDGSRYGAAIGWKVIEALPWDAVKVEVAETGCKGF
ncbi:ABC transporter substrate-binding protein [Rhodoligotrophos ferricapiens]|uniref:ABC transporter substrate-binding protein n=1 Tax=Rhodoligotrophos ferricapiens TaxID=3069264 RepID=UPI00315CBC2B